MREWAATPAPGVAVRMGGDNDDATMSDGERATIGATIARTDDGWITVSA